MNDQSSDAAGAHLVIVFPQDKSTRELLSLAASLERSLSAACGAPPVPVRPDTTALCLLVRGQLSAITRAVDEVIDAYSRWLVVPVGTPHAARGLSTADQWLQRHS